MIYDPKSLDISTEASNRENVHERDDVKYDTNSIFASHKFVLYWKPASPSQIMCNLATKDSVFSDNQAVFANVLVMELRNRNLKTFPMEGSILAHNPELIGFLWLPRITFDYYCSINKIVITTNSFYGSGKTKNKNTINNKNNNNIDEELCSLFIC